MQDGLPDLEKCKGGESEWERWSFDFITKTPPASTLLLKAAKVKKGSGVPNREKVGKVALAEVVKIAELKMPDLYASNVDAAVNTIKGTARSMGLEVID